MATTAQYASTVRCAQVQIVSANISRNGTGILGTLIIGAVNGTRVDDIYITAGGAVTAGVVRLFVQESGQAARLWQEILVTATSPNVTTAVWSYSLLNQALLLQSSWSISAATNNNETFNVIATRAGDF